MRTAESVLLTCCLACPGGPVCVYLEVLLVDLDLDLSSADGARPTRSWCVSGTCVKGLILTSLWTLRSAESSPKAYSPGR